MLNVNSTNRSYILDRQTLGAVIILFLIAIVARLAFLNWRGFLVDRDTADYMQLARNILDYGVYSLSAGPPFIPSIRRSPLFPFFLAILGLPSGHISPTIVAVVQIALDSGVAGLILLLARMIVPLKFAIGASILYALNPGAIFNSCTLLSEALCVVVLVSAVMMIAIGFKANRRLVTGLGGLMLGLTILCRAVFIPLPFIFGLLILFTPRQSHRYSHAILLIVMTSLTVAPWAVRCSLVSGHLVLVQGLSPANFYIATRSDLDQQNESKLWPRLYGRDTDDPYFRLLNAARTPAEVIAADRIGFRQGWQNIRDNPRRYLASRIKSFPHLFLTSFDRFTGIGQSFRALFNQRDIVRLMVKMTLLVLFTLVPFILAVIGLARWRYNLTAALCAVTWLFNWLIHIPMWIEYRYWLPIVPFLLVSSASGAYILKEKFKIQYRPSLEKIIQ